MSHTPEGSPGSHESKILYDEAMRMIDEARGLLDQIGDVMREAEATGVRDHARMDELTSRYEEVHAKEMDAFDRWLAYERAHYGKK